MLSSHTIAPRPGMLGSSDANGAQRAMAAMRWRKQLDLAAWLQAYHGGAAPRFTRSITRRAR